MFGGIAAAGPDRLVFATHDGQVVRIGAESGRIEHVFSLYPAAPRRLHVGAAAVDRDGVVLLADLTHGLVRRFLPDGTPAPSRGGLATPGVENEDAAGILSEPCALLAVGDALWVACGGDEVEHGVQILDGDGSWHASVRHPDGEWRRAQGLARVGDEVWVAETEGDAIRRCDLAGRVRGRLPVHPELDRPFRIAADSWGGALATFAPRGEPDALDDRPPPGIARLDAEGRFVEWAVQPGEEEGRVLGAFDLAVLPDGRFAVADLPYGTPPDVRVQLFAADGRPLAVLVEQQHDLLDRIQERYREVLASGADDPRTRFEQARIHHLHGGGEREILERARALYREALDGDPGLLVAHLGHAALLQEGLGEPEAAEQALRLAIQAGGPRAELLARIAECRHDRGALEGAIALLTETVEGEERPDDFHRRVEQLGSWILERAGEDPEAVV